MQRRQFLLHVMIRQYAISQNKTRKNVYIWFKLNASYTDKKENNIYFIYMEIYMGEVAKSYMSKCFLIYEEMHKYSVIYEEAVSHMTLQFATATFWISLYLRKI
jgi:hypothetical protein